jgi:Ca2+-binding EF-hand superfamily protein
LYKVFTTNEDEGMTFDDYLNLMSVFSEKAPSSIKCRYAFEIYSNKFYIFFQILDNKNLMK